VEVVKLIGRSRFHRLSPAFLGIRAAAAALRSGPVFAGIVEPDPILEARFHFVWPGEIVSSKETALVAFSGRVAKTGRPGRSVGWCRTLLHLEFALNPDASSLP
jgi:hypothetical protein